MNISASSLRLTASLLLGAALLSCGKSDKETVASGTFEATEVVVSAETSGKILRFDLEEGQKLTANQTVGAIDSVQLYLKRGQLNASRKALVSRRPDIRKQVAVLEQQIATARSERKRLQKLVDAQAASTKQLDDLDAQIAVLSKQLDATRSQLETTDQSLGGEDEALTYQLRQLDDQLQKCRITSPIAGTVLAKYAEKGELAVAGKALFRVADTEKLILRAYLTGEQLARIKTGQKVKVFAECGKENKDYEGVVQWISSESEFTPKTIQTRSERANLVYAVKVGVRNDGNLKIGMYGQVRF